MLTTSRLWGYRMSSYKKITLVLGRAWCVDCTSNGTLLWAN